MKLYFLGTGTSQGIPVLTCKCPTCQSTDPKDQRLRCSAWLSVNGAEILLDCGPDFRTQAFRASLPRVDAVLLSHEHRDHIGGLDDLRAYNFAQESDIPVYGPARTLDDIKRAYAYMFGDYPGVPRLNLQPLQDFQIFQIAQQRIQAIPVMHGNLPILGYRFGKIAYLTDVKTLSEEALASLAQLEVLVISALHHEEHHSHLTLEQSLALIEQIAPKQAYLIHMSHRMGLHQEVSLELPPNVAFAYDGLVLEC